MSSAHRKRALILLGIATVAFTAILESSIELEAVTPPDSDLAHEIVSFAEPRGAAAPHRAAIPMQKLSRVLGASTIERRPGWVPRPRQPEASFHRAMKAPERGL